MKKSFLILLLSAFSSVSFAQSSGTISGQVVDEFNKPIEHATVVVLNLPDSSMAKGAVTSSNGNFSINQIKNGNYVVKSSYIGYVANTKNIRITSQNNKHTLGVIKLSTDNVLLDGVTVVGKAAEMVIRNDTVEYNPEAFKTQENAVVEDLLKKLPGVEVASDGKITAGGKQVKKILVDGKEFFADDPTMATKNLTADMIDKLQVVERKSEMERLTGISDGEEETIINLQIKPERKKGWLGNFGAGVGNKDRYEGNGMFNRFVGNNVYSVIGNVGNTNSGRGGNRSYGGGNGNTEAGSLNFSVGTETSPKLKIEGSGQYSFRNTDAESKSYTETFLSNSSQFSDRNSFNLSETDDFNTEFRLEWKPDEYNTFRFKPRAGYSKSNSFSQSDNNTYTEAGNPEDFLNKSNSKSSSESSSQSGGMDVDYSHSFKNKPGRRFNLSVSGTVGENESESFSRSTAIYTINPDANNTDLIRRVENITSSYNYRVYASYVEPVFTNRFLQLSYSYRFNNRESDKKTYARKSEEDLIGELDESISLTNNFENDNIRQQIQASFRTVREKYEYQLGVNIEPQKSTSRRSYLVESENKVLSRSVTNWAPTARFQYNFSREKNLRINYRTNTSQPDLSQLDETIDDSNPSNIRYGNAGLKPSFSQSLEVRLQLMERKSQRSIMASLEGSTTNNSIVSKVIYAEDGSGKRETTYDNVNGVWNTSAFLMTNLPFSTKFRFNSFTRFSFNNHVGYTSDRLATIPTKNITKNSILNQNLGIRFITPVIELATNGSIGYNSVRSTAKTSSNQDVFTYRVNGNVTLFLPLSISLSSDIGYQTSSGYSAGYSQNQTIWNANIQKSVLKNAGMIAFRIYDILQQRQNISRSVSETAITESINNSLTSYFLASFTYRFNLFGGKGGNMPGERPEGMRDGMRERRLDRGGQGHGRW